MRQCSTTAQPRHDLCASGVPIEGEPGVGFRMRRGFQVPPMMVTEEELQALVFGARLVQSCADEALHQAADALLATVDTVLPAHLKPKLELPGLLVADFLVSSEVKHTLRELRGAISDRRRVTFRYTQGDGVTVDISVRPLCLRYVGGTWTLGGWSEGEAAFRVFRIYRIADLNIKQDRFAPERGRDLTDYLAAADRLGAGR